MSSDPKRHNFQNLHTSKYTVFTYYFVSSARIFIYSFNKSASSDAHTLITLLDVGKIRDSFSRILGNSTQLFPVLFHWVLWPQETETPGESRAQSKGESTAKQKERKAVEADKEGMSGK